ncbi:MAG: GNAT family protein [Chloroflexota bacterium]
MTKPMTAYTIREAQPEDAAALVAYLRLLFDEPNNGTSYTRAEDYAMTQIDMRQQIDVYAADPNGIMLVAVNADGIIVGQADANPGPRVFAQTASLGLSVHRDWRRQGVGRALTEAIIAWARDESGLCRLELEVFGNNRKAVALYESLGFEHEGSRRRAAIKHGEALDSLIMAMLFNRPECGD